MFTQESGWRNMWGRSPLWTFFMGVRPSVRARGMSCDGDNVCWSVGGVFFFHWCWDLQRVVVVVSYFFFVF